MHVVFEDNFDLEAITEVLLVRLFLEPTPLAVCNFDQDLCGWSNDNNNWKYRWMRVTQKSSASMREDSLPLLCLPAKPTEENKVKKQSSSWLPIPIKKDKKNTQATLIGDVQARLWSESVPVELGLRCLTFTYSIHLGHSVGSDSTSKLGTLAMLQRQAGCCSLIFEIMHYIISDFCCKKVILQAVKSATIMDKSTIATRF